MAVELPCPTCGTAMNATAANLDAMPPTEATLNVECPACGLALDLTFDARPLLRYPEQFDGDAR